MASVNKVILVGNLGADPDVKTFQNGGKIANISIATSERWTDKNTGEQREATEWHKVVFNDRLAEIVAQYLKKGSSVYVEGSLKTRKYTDSNGIERYVTEIKAQSMQMLGSRTDGGQAPQAHNGYPQQHQAPAQGQQYQTINGHPTTTPVGQPMPVTPPMWQGGQVPDEDVPF